jgi:ATP-dependent DNA helicase RecQ
MLGSLSQLTRRDIAQVLRKLRLGLRRTKPKGDKDRVLVITTGELLREEDVDTSFDVEDSMADTKVKTALAWLERADFLKRDVNETSVFQGKPRIKSLQEAEAKIDGLTLSLAEREQWLEVLLALINADSPDGLNADTLAELPSFQCVPQRPAAPSSESATASQHVMRTLDQMARAGLIRKGVMLSAFVRFKIADSSSDRVQRATDIERALLQHMQELEPDAADQDWLSLSLRRLNQALVDQGLPSSPELIRSLLLSLSFDGRGYGGNRASLEFRHSRDDHYRVKLHRDWPALIETSDRRRQVAAVVLRTILEQVPARTAPSSGLLVEFSSDDLTRVVESDLALKGQLKDVVAAVDRGLMYLHEQQAIILQRGLSVFRQAMTIRMPPESKGRKYTQGDFDPLKQHYREKRLQIHVMYEYARRAIQSLGEGLRLVFAYFTQPRDEFIQQFFGDRKEVLQRAITHEGYQRIVDNLNNPVQQAVVAAPHNDSLLILAGPGSGKTCAIVHRVAYLVKVEQMRPRSILVLCFNRLAAIQLKQRLRELIGKSASRVTVMTYHALAARLTGTSFAERATDAGDAPIDLADLIPTATAILRGTQPVPGVDEDEVRDRLLAGYRFVLVDEYQDIDEEQYELISALTDRTGADPDAKLSILAVGDDDQNIYSFRGTNVAYIQRFQRDYQARCHYLLENYRSTANIIDAANQLIAHNQDRMKTHKAIRINRAREKDPPGGPWQAIDPVARGKVRILELAREWDEAATVVFEIQRLRHLQPDFDFNSLAVLSRTRGALHPIRAACEFCRIPLRWGLDSEQAPSLHKIREIAALLDRLDERRDEDCSAKDLLDLCGSPPDDNPWYFLLSESLAAWREETGDAKLPVDQAIQYLYESFAEQRREQRVGNGVFLSTVHSAKGMEFDHVLIPSTGWKSDGDCSKREEERRLYYVAMTRARYTLGLLTRQSPPNPHIRLLKGDFLDRCRAQCEPSIPAAILHRKHEVLGMEDIDIGFAGSHPAGHPIHGALANLEPGSRLELQPRNGHLELLDSNATCVGRLSKTACDRWRKRLELIQEIRVVALLRRRQRDERPEYSDRCRCEKWEIPWVEVIYVSHRN